MPPILRGITANQKKEFPLLQCFLSYLDEMRKSYRGSSIDDSCKISPFRRGYIEIDHQKQELPMAATFVNGSERNEQSSEDPPTKFRFI